VDVRVVAATNRDLQEEVRLGRFRADLYYRLSVFPLRVPPLRERRGDVPKLVTYFLGRCARRFGRQIDSVSRETMNRLTHYTWPGNVRELQNIIERAVILSRGPELVLGDDLLPLAPADPVPIELLAPADGAPLSLKEKEKQHILRVLAQTSGVIEGLNGAARILDIHPNTLRSRMKRLGIR
jgi:formate hydrogenlyase transcriptional activator